MSFFNLRLANTKRNGKWKMNQLSTHNLQIQVKQDSVKVPNMKRIG